MPINFKTGWLKNNNGEKFAPKTLTSQIQTNDGILFEDKLQADLLTLKNDIQTENKEYIDNKIETIVPDVPVTSVNGKTGDINLTAVDVGAEASGSVSSHNTSNTAHNDIRILLSELTTRLNTLADSDDTTLDQMSEIVAYIKANKSLIESITTNKVNVADIVDNLTTNTTNKPLSAAQGVALKALIDNMYTKSDLDPYIFMIDYDNTLAFDTTEIIINNTTSTTSVLGKAILGRMILA